MQVMGQMGDNLTHEEAEQMIKEVDVNNDGHIDYEEFVVLMLKQKWVHLTKLVPILSWRSVKSKNKRHSHERSRTDYPTITKELQVLRLWLFRVHLGINKHWLVFSNCR